MPGHAPRASTPERRSAMPLPTAARHRSCAPLRRARSRTNAVAAMTARPTPASTIGLVCTPPSSDGIRAGCVGSTSSAARDEHQLARGALQHHDPGRPPDVARLPAVPPRPVDVTEHAARQDRVEEHGAVALRDGLGDVQPQADPLRDQPPPQRGAHGREQPQRERRRRRPRPDDAQPGGESTGAEHRCQRDEHRDPTDDAQPRDPSPLRRVLGRRHGIGDVSRPGVRHEGPPFGRARRST